MGISITNICLFLQHFLLYDGDINQHGYYDELHIISTGIVKEREKERWRDLTIHILIRKRSGYCNKILNFSFRSKI